MSCGEHRGWRGYSESGPGGGCGCGHPAHHVPRGGWHHPWGRQAPSYGYRRFPTREEVILNLEEYLKDLQTEAKGVEERIAELRKGT
ncbi:MAG: hypothetical protein HY664_05475 [Chloroflexi bacterium]|nr:hypothetical protein [Chloroflexota bacterium]